MIVEIEDAIISALKKTGLFKQVESYQGELATDNWKDLISRFPAAWIAYAGDWQDPKRLSTGHDIYPTFSVVIAARNLRGEKQARRGGAGNETGAYELLDATHHALGNQTLDIDIDPFAPRASEPLFIGQAQKMQMAIYGVDFQTRIHIPYRVEADPFNKATASWPDGTDQQIKTGE